MRRSGFAATKDVGCLTFGQITKLSSENTRLVDILALAPKFVHLSSPKFDVIMV